MLKPYVERSRHPVLQPVNVNVFVSEPKEDLSSELRSNSFVSGCSHKDRSDL